MTEPVAYKRIYDDGVVGYGKNKSNRGVKNIPLYTAEQLRPRVKMTQAEFDEFFLLYKKLSNSTAMGILNTVIHNESKEFGNLKSLILKVGGDFKILSLFDNFDSENPEETIEIVPDMKWFVRRILPNSGGNMLYCTDEGELTYNHNKEYATQFDTKEEAEKWTNPLTEVVQLPVEGE